MIEKDEGSKQKYLLCLVIFLCIVCLCLSCSTVVSSPANDPNTAGEPNSVTDAEQRASDIAMRSATRMATTGFRPSLEMKENADFLLTPALLMQESLSYEIVATYPSE